MREVQKIFMFFLCLDINECDPNPCEHDGSCIDRVNGYKCSCKAGYTGTNCEIGTKIYHIINLYKLNTIYKYTICSGRLSLDATKSMTLLGSNATPSLVVEERSRYEI